MEKQISEELPRLFEALNISDKQAQEALTRKAAAVSCGKGEQLPQRSNGEGFFMFCCGAVCAGRWTRPTAAAFWRTYSTASAV